MVKVKFRGETWEHRATFNSIRNGSKDFLIRSLDKKRLMVVCAGKCKEVDSDIKDKENP